MSSGFIIVVKISERASFLCTCFTKAKFEPVITILGYFITQTSPCITIFAESIFISVNRLRTYGEYIADICLNESPCGRSISPKVVGAPQPFNTRVISPDDGRPAKAP